MKIKKTEITVKFTVHDDDIRAMHSDLYEDAAPENIGDVFGQVIDGLLYDPDADSYIAGKYEIVAIGEVAEEASA